MTPAPRWLRSCRASCRPASRFATTASASTNASPPGDFDALLDRVFSDLPEPVLTPAACYQRLIRNGTKRVSLADVAGRIAAAIVVITPPGIPMLMPGESIGPDDGALMTYLRALEDLDRAFPELSTDIHGAHRDADGRYWIECTKD